MSDAFNDIVAKAVPKVQAAMKKKNHPADVTEAMQVLADQAHLTSIKAISIDCLPLEYMLGTAGLPMHRMLTIQGPNKSSKSSMFWYLARQILAAGGYVLYFDLEGKYDEPTAQAYVGNPIAFHNRVRVIKTGSTDAFQQLLTRLLTTMLRSQKKMEHRPILIGIDTLGTSSSAGHLKSTLGGTADPGYNPAKSAGILQSALQHAMAYYMDRLPMIIVALQQERKAMGDSDEIYPTGGTYSGYSKSVAWRMRAFSYWKFLDKKLPLLRLEQVKVANNIERSIRLTLPTGYRKNKLNLKEYWFQWDYAFLQLLTDIPPTMLEGILNVERPTEKSFAIKATTRKKDEYSVFEERYAGQSGPYADLGYSLLHDAELLTVLRRALDINVYQPFNSPYVVKTSLDGHMWLGPDECEHWDTLDEDQILDFHGQWLEENIKNKVEEAEPEPVDSEDEDESEDEESAE